ncbi:unnamed protein product [Rhizophagus irregularis]|uniref:Uncharacterized protein n=1 Tax=Rhizophagus irregularis TaxID=588596 RepID=A0A915ZRQ0_9GLOM|nr:unnamed protein product [Rhizophagus irregularis]CAB5387528.1 unnamed protein product [Rhizophagus irregularis]
MQNKHKQLAKEAERQILVQEEESDADSDYKATNSSKSEEEASDQTISDNSDNDVINISDDNDDDDADIGINENVLKLQDLKQVGYGISLEKLKMVLKLFVKLRAVKKCLNGDQNLISNIIEEEKSKSHPYSKQELLTKNVPCTKTLKERISLAYEAGTEKVKNQLLQLENISLTLDAWSSSAHIPYLDVTVH